MLAQPKRIPSHNAAAAAVISKVVGASSAASPDAIDREICSQPNCAKCLNKSKLAARWKHRVDLSDVYED